MSYCVAARNRELLSRDAAVMGGKLLVRASSDESLASQNLQRTNSHAHEQPSSSSSQHEHLPPQGKGWGLYWVLQSQEESCLFFIWFIYCLPSLSLSFFSFSYGCWMSHYHQSSLTTNSLFIFHLILW